MGDTIADLAGEHGQQVNSVCYETDFPPHLRCRNWDDTGQCSYGHDCKFVHVWDMSLNSDFTSEVAAYADDAVTRHNGVVSHLAGRLALPCDNLPIGTGFERTIRRQKCASRWKLTTQHGREVFDAPSLWLQLDRRTSRLAREAAFVKANFPSPGSYEAAAEKGFRHTEHRHAAWREWGAEVEDDAMHFSSEPLTGEEQRWKDDIVIADQAGMAASGDYLAWWWCQQHPLPTNRDAAAELRDKLRGKLRGARGQ